MRVRIEASGSGISLASATTLSAAGTLIVAQGKEASHNVVVLDAIGNPMSHGTDEYLTVQIENPAVAAWATDKPGAFVGRLQGVSAGTTAARFVLMHRPSGGSDHADFTSAKIEVAVN